MEQLSSPSSFSGFTLDDLNRPDLGSAPCRKQREQIAGIDLTIFGHKIAVSQSSNAQTKITTGSKQEGWVLIERCPTDFCSALHTRVATLLPESEEAALESISKDTWSMMYSDAKCPEMEAICQQLCAMSDDDFAQTWQLFVSEHGVKFHDFIWYLQNIDQALLSEEDRLNLCSKLDDMAHQQAVTLMHKYGVTVMLDTESKVISEDIDAKRLWDDLFSETLFSFQSCELKAQGDSGKYVPLNPADKPAVIKDVHKLVCKNRLNELCENHHSENASDAILSALYDIAQGLLGKGCETINKHTDAFSQRLPYRYEQQSPLKVVEGRLSVAQEKMRGFTVIDFQFVTKPVKLNNQHETSKELYGGIQLVWYGDSSSLAIRHAMLSSDQSMLNTQTDP